MRLFARSFAHGQQVDVDGLSLRLRVNPRARRVSLRLDARTGEAVATAPSTGRLADAVAFARARRGWLAERMAADAAAPSLPTDGRLVVFGQVTELAPDGRRPRLQAGILSGCGQGAVDSQLVVRALRQAALTRFTELAATHCARLGVSPPRLAIMDARTRWGSCTPPTRGDRGSIRLSWRLALAPPAVADYVVAHECAHLLEANHGPRFWALVRKLVGEPAPHRAFLRRHGPALHAVCRTRGSVL